MRCSLANTRKVITSIMPRVTSSRNWVTGAGVVRLRTAHAPMTGKDSTASIPSLVTGTCVRDSLAATGAPASVRPNKPTSVNDARATEDPRVGLLIPELKHTLDEGPGTLRVDRVLHRAFNQLVQRSKFHHLCRHDGADFALRAWFLRPGAGREHSNCRPHHQQQFFPIRRLLSEQPAGAK